MFNTRPFHSFARKPITMKSKIYLFIILAWASFLVCCQAQERQKRIAVPLKEAQFQTPNKEQGTLRIYEQSEVDTRAVFPMSNSQFLKFYTENFKYPNIEPITENGEMDLVIDEEGYIKDVLIIKSVHPELDKEFIRIIKLLPRFTQPGKLNGKPVRSKYRLPISARAF